VITSNLRNSLSTDFFNFYFFLKKNKNLKDYDVIIIENLSLSQLAGFLKKHSPKCRIYYDAHNVDSAIARIDWGKGKISKRGYKHVLAIESSLFKKFDAIWTCSDVDAEQFNFLNEGKIKIKVIPNGTEIKPNNLKIQGNRNKLLFCGSLDYAPNEEGLIWFLKEIWPLLLEKCDDISLTVIGRGLLSQDLKAILCLASVNYQGEVKDVLPFYAETDVVIVPLLSGSGTRLKVLEAMAYNRPIVSTSKGAEGINYERNGHLLIEDDPYSFAKGILELLTNSELYAKLSKNPNLLIKDHNTWYTIGLTLKEIILEWKESTSQCIDDGI
jgi:glycosyltransferase involved in cell wall biosynthesis